MGHRSARSSALFCVRRPFGLLLLLNSRAFLLKGDCPDNRCNFQKVQLRRDDALSTIRYEQLDEFERTFEASLISPKAYPKNAWSPFRYVLATSVAKIRRVQAGPHDVPSRGVRGGEVGDDGRTRCAALTAACGCAGCVMSRALQRRGLTRWLLQNSNIFSLSGFRNVCCLRVLAQNVHEVLLLILHNTCIT